MLTLEIENNINNWVNKLQKKYIDCKKEIRDYWKIFDSTIQLLNDKEKIEEFVWIKDYEGSYLISNYGRVYSKKREKLLKLELINEYYRVSLSLGEANTKDRQLVHRLVLKNFIGPCPSGMECRHKDGNSLNNYIDNLEWNTHEVNELDRIKHGTYNIYIGEKHSKSIFSESIVKEIRKDWRTGKYTQNQLSNKYNCSRGAICGIINNLTWKHIQ